VGFLRFEAGVQEIFAVQVLQGIRFPEVLEFTDERLSHSYVLPEDAFAAVSLPTQQDLAHAPACHVQRGTDLYRQGQLAEAMAAARRCVVLQPDDPNARDNLGVVLGAAAQVEEAVVCFHHVSRPNPSGPKRTTA
jgi:Flp pilus assembly protein TadD